jgi:hypothetical protein
MYSPTQLEKISKSYLEVGGWISPSGKIFLAEYEEHYSVACDILSEYLGEGGWVYASDELEDHGWIRLETTGEIWHPFTPTQAQLDVLYWCYARAIPGYYKRTLWKQISPFLLEDVQEKLPLIGVPPQGDQENWRLTPVHRELIKQCAERSMSV